MTAEHRSVALVPNEPGERAIATLAARLLPEWPKDLTPPAARELARLALAYELDPFAGELIVYRSRPYITFAGRIRIADRHPAYDGWVDEPLSEAEERALKLRPGEVGWKATVYRRDRKYPIRAYGRANGPTEQNPLGKSDPIGMAMERAIHRALKASFPVSIPGAEVQISGGQIRAIHAVDDELEVSRAERRGVLEGTFGVSASNELTADQASAYLDARTVDVDVETGEVRDETSYGMEDEVRAIDDAATPADVTAVQQQIDADWGSAIDGASELSEAVTVANQIRKRYGSGHPLTKRAGERVTELSTKKAQS